MNIIGIDLAKNIFHVCVMNEKGRVLRRKKCSRKQLFEYIVTKETGVVAMEACGGSNYWARCFENADYEVKIIAAHLVKPYVKSQKNDAADAEAICEAASREGMRTISTRSEEQQDIQNVHRVRERLVAQRTGVGNQIRGLLLEYGIVIPQGMKNLRVRLLELISETSEHSELWIATFTDLNGELASVDKRIEACDKRLKEASEGEEYQRAQQIPGVGVIISTAIISSVGNFSDFKNGRQFAASLGLVPRQNTTGGKVRLGHITKQGDGYLRKQLVQGAWAVAMHMGKRDDTLARWFKSLCARRGAQIAVVALANKIARCIWAVIAKGEDYKTMEELNYV
jgi:transposase